MFYEEVNKFECLIGLEDQLISELQKRGCDVCYYKDIVDGRKIIRICKGSECIEFKIYAHLLASPEKIKDLVTSCLFELDSNIRLRSNIND